MATKTWVGSQAVGGDDWNTADNWDPVGVPVAADDVEIMNSDNAIAAYDNSAVDLGNVNIGPGFLVDIGDDGPGYLILSFQSNKRLTINGAPASKTQAMFIEIDTTNPTDVYCESYGIISSAGMADDGIHLKDTSGPAVDTNYRNSGCPLTLDSGTFQSLIDNGTAQSVISSNVTAIIDYQSHGFSVVSIIGRMPAVLFTVSAGTITITAATGSVFDVVQTGGTIDVKGIFGIGTLLKVDGGTFDTSNNVGRAIYAAVEVSGDKSTTLVDLSNAIISGNIRNNATEAVLIFPVGSDLTIS